MGDGAASHMEMHNRVNKPLKARCSRGFLENKVMLHFSSASERLTDSPGPAIGCVLLGSLEGPVSLNVLVAWDTEWKGLLCAFQIRLLWGKGMH